MSAWAANEPKIRPTGEFLARSPPLRREKMAFGHFVILKNSGFSIFLIFCAGGNLRTLAASGDIMREVAPTGDIMRKIAPTGDTMRKVAPYG